MADIIIKFLHVLFLTFVCLCQVRLTSQEINPTFWEPGSSDGWRPNSAPRGPWLAPPNETTHNGHLSVIFRLSNFVEQRQAICDAVVVARILNATLVLPDDDGFLNFREIYDLDHFVDMLKNDVLISRSLPKTQKTQKMIHTRREAPISWYIDVVLPNMRRHGAVTLIAFGNGLAKELDDYDYQRLRCRVMYKALKFIAPILEHSNAIVSRLRSASGHFMAIQLRFDKDSIAHSGCFDVVTEKEAHDLREYREREFGPDRFSHLSYAERRAEGKCPLTPGEVAIALEAMGLENTTSLYITAHDVYGDGDRFMGPLRYRYPYFDTLETQGLAEYMVSPIDYAVCLESNLFFATYDDRASFHSVLPSHRLYEGFRQVIQPNSSALAALFIRGQSSLGFQKMQELMLHGLWMSTPHARAKDEQFYQRPWPECFCKPAAGNKEEMCPN